MTKDRDSSVGCIVAIGVTFLLAIAGVGIAAAGLMHLERQKQAEAAKAQAAREAAEARAKREAEEALDSGLPPPPWAVLDAGLAASIAFVPVGTSPVRGAPDALVTMIEFSDFQCPYCAKVQPTLDRLRTEYGADLRMVWKNQPLPMHANAEPAAQMAFEARAQKGNAGFWKAHDALFADQAHLSVADLVMTSSTLGFDAVKVNDAMAMHKYKTAIDEDTSLALAMHVSGIPTFYINGALLTGAQPYAAFKTTIDAELVKARALVAAGLPRNEVYDSIFGK